MHHKVFKATGVLVVAALLAVASISPVLGSAARDASTSTGFAGSDGSLKGKLLRLADVRAIEGVPAEIKPRSAGESGLSENKDPRGPCGAKIHQPSLAHALLRVFASNGISIVSIVVRVPEAKGRAFLDAVIEDATPGCPTYTSRTNTGARQHVKTTIVELPELADQRFAATARVSVGAQTIYGGEVVLRSGDLVSIVNLVTVLPPNPTLVQGLADHASTRLTAP